MITAIVSPVGPVTVLGILWMVTSLVIAHTIGRRP